MHPPLEHLQPVDLALYLTAASFGYQRCSHGVV